MKNERIFYMKRILALLLVLAAVFAVGCQGDGEESVDISAYPSRTAAFFGTMDKSSFWFSMSFTNNGETYDFAQATDGKTVTTIETHKDHSRDRYDIYNGDLQIHQLHIGNRSYDTIVGAIGQEFIFADYEADMFSNPTERKMAEFEGESCYCETFVTTKNSGGSATGFNRYYFDEKNRLVAFEWVENGKTVMTMRFVEYSNTIPEDVYLSAPSDFKRGTLQVENPGVDYSEIWGDIE